jgi:hypothetical protein
VSHREKADRLEMLRGIFGLHTEKRAASQFVLFTKYCDHSKDNWNIQRT